MPRRTDIESILIIGAGPIVIGQACEFDYSGTQAVKTLKEEGYRIVLVNSNPATIMTDPELADATYIEPITPDIVAIAKPIAAGLPLGAFLAKEDFASAISIGQHGTTFGGGPLSCYVALEYLAILEEEKLLDNVARVGSYLQQELKALLEKYAGAKEVRGRGLIQGLELDIPARPIVEQALAEGMLFNSTQDTVLRFLPPFLLEEKHVDRGIKVLKKLLGKKKTSWNPF